MTAILSSRLVSSSILDNKACRVISNFVDTSVVPIEYKDTSVVPLAFRDTVIIQVNVKECSVTQAYNKSKEVDLYVPQGSNIVFRFDDVDDTVDYSTMSAVTFNVWDSVSTGSTVRISKDLVSGITITDTDKINVTLSGTDTAIAAQEYYFELWATTSGGSRYLLKFGGFVIEDTRKHD